MTDYSGAPAGGNLPFAAAGGWPLSARSLAAPSDQSHIGQIQCQQARSEVVARGPGPPLLCIIRNIRFDSPFFWFTLRRGLAIVRLFDCNSI